MMANTETEAGRSVAEPTLEVRGPMTPSASSILTPSALSFVALLEHRFGARRRQLLERRSVVQARLDAGELPDFLPETAEIRGATGRWLPSPRTCATAASRSPGPSTAR